jgi:phosphorylase kinase alpha/beta subunit
MRSLLFSMMCQVHKVETFKQTQATIDSLHAKYGMANGKACVGDTEWGHLQVDATSLFGMYGGNVCIKGLVFFWSCACRMICLGRFAIGLLVLPNLLIE